MNCILKPSLQSLLKRMVTACHCKPAVIIDLPYEEVSHTQRNDSRLARPTSTVNTVHYKPTKEWEVQLTRHKIGEVKDSQCPAEDWLRKVNAFGAYSEYYNKFINMLSQFFYIWDGR